MGDLAIDASWFYSLIFGPGPGETTDIPPLNVAAGANDDSACGPAGSSCEGMSNKARNLVLAKEITNPLGFDSDKAKADAGGDCKWNGISGEPSSWNFKFRQGVLNQVRYPPYVGVPAGVGANPWGAALVPNPPRLDPFAVGFCKWNATVPSWELVNHKTGKKIGPVGEAAGENAEQAPVIAAARAALAARVVELALADAAHVSAQATGGYGLAYAYQNLTAAQTAQNDAQTYLASTEATWDTPIGRNILAQEMWKGCRQRLLTKKQRVNFILGEGEDYVDELGVAAAGDVVPPAPGDASGRCTSNSYPFGWHGACLSKKFIWIGQSVSNEYRTETIVNRHLVMNPLWGPGDPAAAAAHRQKTAREYNMVNNLCQAHIASKANVALAASKYFRRFANAGFNKLKTTSGYTVTKFKNLSKFLKIPGFAGGGQVGGGRGTPRL